MGLPRLAVARPIAVIMTVLALLLLGSMAYLRLPVDLFPRLTFPVLVVITGLPGAGPEEVGSLVTRPVEQVVATVSNLHRMRSETGEGAAIIIAEFSWGTNMDLTALELREKLDRAAGLLPQDMDTPVVLRTDPSLMPVVIMTLSGDGDRDAFTRLAKEEVRGRLERLEGVAAVDVYGGPVPEVQVLADPELLARFGLGLDHLVSIIRGESASLPAGMIADGSFMLPVRVLGSLPALTDLETLPIGRRGPQIVTVGDVARVESGYQGESGAVMVDGSPAVAIAVRKNADANTVAVSRRVRAELADMNLPEGITLSTVVDQASFIEDAISGLIRDALIGSVLAILVMFAFIRSLGNILVVATAIPISVITCFIPLYFAGLTLNIMSLAGLAISVGILLDNAIIVIENIDRRRQLGDDPVSAAQNGAGEVMAPVGAATLTTVSVFLPVIFVTGLASHLFRELALTVSFTVLLSLVVAFTVIPLWASRAPSRLTARASSWWLGDVYGKSLDWTLRHRVPVAVFSIIGLVAGSAFLAHTGAGFLPVLDQGEVVVEISMEPGTGLDATMEQTWLVHEQLSAIPEVERILLEAGGGNAVGMGPARGQDSAQLTLHLVDPRKRALSTEGVAERIRNILEPVPGVDYRVSSSEGMGGMSHMAGPDVEIVLCGPDPNVLADISSQAAGLLADMPGLLDVSSRDSGSRPEVRLQLDREQAVNYGISTFEIGRSLDAAIQGTVAGRMNISGDEVDVRVMMAPEHRDGLASLGTLPVPSPGGQITMTDLVEMTVEAGPRSLSRRDQQPSVSLDVWSTSRDIAGLKDEIDQRMAGLNLPSGYTLDYQGQYGEMVESFRSMGGALALAVVLVYMVLAGQLESLFRPLVLMVTVPLSLVGAMGALILTGTTLNLVSIIGGVMLAGIAVNDSIVFMDFARREQARGLSLPDALRSAGQIRLRPIIMTTLTTVLALVPVALSWGRGAEAYAPFGIVLVAGLWVATLVSLLVLPALSLVVHDILAREA